MTYPMAVYLPCDGYEESGWRDSPKDWAETLREDGKFGDGKVQFYRAELLGHADVVIPEDGTFAVEVPEGTSSIVVMIDGEPSDEGDTIEEIVQRVRDLKSCGYDFPLEAGLVFWRHAKHAETIDLSAVVEVCASEQNT